MAIIYKCNFGQSRKYCKAIKDYLLLFTLTKKSHIAKLEDLMKALIKMELRYHERSISSLEKNYNVWEMLYLLKIREYV